MTRQFYLSASFACALCAAAQAAPVLTRISSLPSGTFNADGGGAEVPAFDPVSKKLFVVNAVNRLINTGDLANPAAPINLPGTLSLAGYTPNSVAVRNGVVAVAFENNVKTNPGEVAFFRASDNAFLGQTTVGFLPDMLTFSPDGSKVLVANEGEPLNYLSPANDPEGSVSVINVSFPNAGNIAINNNVNVGFTAFNGQKQSLNNAGVRIYGPGATVAQDLEPEYVAVNADGTRAFVTLQEANALATIDLTNNTILSIKSFGFKDHSLAGNGLDASDRDNAAGTAGAINITAKPVRGLYMPDAIATFQSGGQTFLVTANEGDAREYAGFGPAAPTNVVNPNDVAREDPRLSDAAIVLNPASFPNAAILKGNGPQGIGRLRITAPRLNDVNGDGTPDRMGDTNGDGTLEEIYVLGGRSFSIRDQDGNLVFDSGDDLEQIVAAAFANNFNADHSTAGGNTLDTRSPAKGPEPESVTVGEVDGTPLLFVGLERMGGIMMYDLTNPANPSFLQYLNPRDFAIAPTSALAGDLGPEVLTFVPASLSPNGAPLLIVGNEVSGNVSIFTVPEPAVSGVALAGALLLRRRRRASQRSRFSA